MERLTTSSWQRKFATDVCINLEAKIEFVGKYNMMDVRWNIIEFNHGIPQADKEVITSCPRCFTELALLGSSDYFHIFRPSFLKFSFLSVEYIYWCCISFVKKPGHIRQQRTGNKGNRAIFRALSKADIKKQNF